MQQRTVLEIIQDVVVEIGHKVTSEVSTAASSTDPDIKKLIRFMHAVADDLMQEFKWAELQKTGTVTLVAGEADYALAGDINYMHYNSFWDTDNQWPLFGPYNPQEWRTLNDGITAVLPQSRFSIHGIANKQIHILPVPAAGDDGNTFQYEFQSSSWLRPRTWEASAAFSANEYCFYDGNIYQTTTAGTSGSTAPTHTTGTENDGGIDWTYYTGAYDRILKDTDIPVLPSRVIEMGLIHYFYLRVLGNGSLEGAFKRKAKQHASNLRSARTITIGKKSSLPLAGYHSYPDTGFGQ